jgi:amidophosphoribosyltransferase
VTYGIVRKGLDNLVIIDDSIVRGTTLKKSIIKILDRLGPKKIIIVSSAPQIRYPDCYGIDMAIMGDFIAFQAAIELIKEKGMTSMLEEIYHSAKEELKSTGKIQNMAKKVYEPFTYQEVSDKIAQLVTPPDTKAEVKVIFQTVEDLRIACPNNHGDWYFSGNFPTEGGMKVGNRAYMNFFEGKKVRAY